MDFENSTKLLWNFLFSYKFSILSPILQAREPLLQNICFSIYNKVFISDYTPFPINTNIEIRGYRKAKYRAHQEIHSIIWSLKVTTTNILKNPI